MSLELPPLKQAKIYGAGPGVNPQQLFTVEETKDYARAAQRMALEEAAKLAEREDSYNLAAAIRKLAEGLK